MDKKELRKLSKSDLIRIILEERQLRIDTEKRVEAIERYLRAFDNPHTPSSKQLKKNTKKKDEDGDSDDKTDRTRNHSNQEKPHMQDTKDLRKKKNPFTKNLKSIEQVMQHPEDEKP